MPRREDSPRFLLAVHLALAVVVVVLAGWATLRWSLISVGVDGRVVDTAWAEEGPDYRVVVLQGGPTLTIDAGLFERMGGAADLEGAHLATRAGSRTARVDGRAVPLRLSAVSWRVLGLVLVAVAVGVVRTWRSLQVMPGADPDDPDPGGPGQRVQSSSR